MNVSLFIHKSIVFVPTRGPEDPVARQDELLLVADDDCCCVPCIRIPEDDLQALKQVSCCVATTSVACVTFWGFSIGICPHEMIALGCGALVP